MVEIKEVNQMREIVRNSSKKVIYFSVYRKDGKTEDVIKYWLNDDYRYCLSCSWNNHRNVMDTDGYMEDIINDYIDYCSIVFESNKQTELDKLFKENEKSSKELDYLDYCNI